MNILAKFFKLSAPPALPERSITKEAAGTFTWRANADRFEVQFDPAPERTRHAHFCLLRLPGTVRGKKILIRGTFKAGCDARATMYFSKTCDSFAEHFHKSTLFLSSEEAFISVLLEADPADASDVFVHLYLPKTIDQVVTGNAIEVIVCGESPQRFVPSVAGELGAGDALDLTKKWWQEKDVLYVEWLGRHFHARMPKKWKLAGIDERSMNAVNDFLFGPIELTLFGVPRFRLQRLPAKDRSGKQYAHQTLLSYSTGEDSTAALILLGNDTPTFHVKRDYTHYRIGNGAVVEIGDKKAEADAVQLVKSCICIPTNFETISISVGGRHGFADSYGYVLFGMLLAEFVGARSVAVGSQLDTSLLENGRNFIDVIEQKGSQFHGFKNVFDYVGLDLVSPCATISEVLTNRLCRLHSDRFLALSCPASDENHVPCGVCYKCFRKTRFSGENEVKEPSAQTVEFFEKAPLKMAMPTMYAVTKSGFRHPSLDPYRNYDYSFLERYYPYALQHFVPDYLRETVKTNLERNGVEPMTESDEIKLRSVGELFRPETFNERRSFPPRLFDGRKRRFGRTLTVASAEPLAGPRGRV